MPSWPSRLSPVPWCVASSGQRQLCRTEPQARWPQVSILTASLSVCFSVMRRPCLRPWLDWPLKGKNGAPSNMSPALHSRSCGECRGQQGMWQSILACLTFNLLSICLRTMVGLLLVLVGAAFLVARLLSSGSSSSKPIADMESDAQHVALGYLQAITLNWFVMSLVPYAATWLFSWARKSEPFPFPFETVMASNSQPFPEEELAILVSAAPTLRGRSSHTPTRRPAWGVTSTILGSGVAGAAEAAVARMEYHQGHKTGDAFISPGKARTQSNSDSDSTELVARSQGGYGAEEAAATALSTPLLHKGEHG